MLWLGRLLACKKNICETGADVFPYDPQELMGFHTQYNNYDKIIDFN